MLSMLACHLYNFNSRNNLAVFSLNTKYDHIKNAFFHPYSKFFHIGHFPIGKVQGLFSIAHTIYAIRSHHFSVSNPLYR